MTKSSSRRVFKYDPTCSQIATPSIQRKTQPSVKHVLCVTHSMASNGELSLYPLPHTFPGAHIHMHEYSTTITENCAMCAADSCFPLHSSRLPISLATFGILVHAQAIFTSIVVYTPSLSPLSCINTPSYQITQKPYADTQPPNKTNPAAEVAEYRSKNISLKG